jgi:5-methylthioadenosine/S-adenosylhomocysteine deaminase
MSVLIKNCTILTQDSHRRILKGDILIEGEGIAKVGAGISAKAEHKVDGTGKLALPGLVNCHTHVAMSLLRGYAEDMELHDWLSRKIWPAEKRFSPKSVRAGALLSCLEMIKGGTTCFNDTYFSMDEVAQAAQESGMRATLSYSMIDFDDGKKRKAELAETERFVKKWSGEKGIGLAIGPHAPNTCSKELLLKSRELAEKHKLGMHIHLSETRREVFDIMKKTGKRPVDYLDSAGVLGKGTVAAHCVWVTKSEIALLAKTGTHACACPVSNMKLASGGTIPIPEMLAAGANVCLGTDGAASNNSQSMLESMKFCDLLQRNMRWDPCALKTQDVLDFATRNGGRALGWNSGSIEQGKLADIILVDAKAPNMAPVHSPPANIVYSANDGNVTHAIINGKLVMEDRKVLTLDEDKVIESAQKEAERITGSG